MQSETQPGIGGFRVLSLPPTHLILLLLDEMKGKPQTVIELTDKLSKRLASTDGLLTKYVDVETLVEDDLPYLERLRLADMVPMADGTGVRITTLGSLMALGLQSSAPDQP